MNVQSFKVTPKCYLLIFVSEFIKVGEILKKSPFSAALLLFTGGLFGIMIGLSINGYTGTNMILIF